LLTMMEQLLHLLGADGSSRKPCEDLLEKSGANDIALEANGWYMLCNMEISKIEDLACHEISKE
jgi:hypothetical protein